MFLFLIIALPVLHVAWWWNVHRLLRHAAHARLWRSGLAIVAGSLLVVFVLLVATRLLRLAADVPVPLLALTFVWFLVVLPASCIAFTPIAGAVTWMSAWRRHPLDADSDRRPRVTSAPEGNLERVVAHECAEHAPLHTQRTTRRTLLTAAIGLAPPIAALGATARGLTQLDEFRIRRISVPLPTLPPSLDGMTIVNISDVHVGNFTNGPTLRKIADAANNLRPDLIVLTGDLIDYSLSDLPAGLEMVKRLEAPGGVYMCEGNHDLFESRSEFERRVVRAGTDLLLNQSAVVRVRGAQLQVLGLRWGRVPLLRENADALSSVRPQANQSSGVAMHDPPPAIAHADSPSADAQSRGAGVDQNMRVVLSRRDPEAFAILLAHHPHAFDPAADAGIPLTLAGHTHGGQLMLSRTLGAGPLLFRYWSGLYTRNNCALVVSNGVGNWFPLRLNAPAEIVHLTLRRA